jgi:hypothetical protein
MRSVGAAVGVWASLRERDAVGRRIVVGLQELIGRVRRVGGAGSDCRRIAAERDWLLARLEEADCAAGEALARAAAAEAELVAVDSALETLVAQLRRGGEFPAGVGWPGLVAGRWCSDSRWATADFPAVFADDR